MPYIDIVNTHGRNNLFEYGHKEIYKQVRRAMKKTGGERDRALKEVLTAAYKKESVRYEAMRQQLIADLNSMENANESARLDMEMKSMARPAQFLEQMAEIVGEMAKDIDASYKPKGMIGLTTNEAKNLVSFQLSSYTRIDETMYSLKKFGWEDAHISLGHIRTNTLTGETRSFATTDDEHKAGMYDVYIRKEELKNQLNSKGFFWKLFHRADVRAMNDYINAAEEALTAVGFPESAIGEAKAEFACSAATESEYATAYKHFDDKFYVSEDEVEQLLENKSDEEMLEMFDEKAAREDKRANDRSERIEKKKLEEQKKEAEKQEFMANLKKPTNIRELKSAFANKTLTEIVKGQFVDLMSKATKSYDDKKSIAGSTIRSLGMVISDAWTDQEKMHAHAIRLFKVAYNALRKDTPNMSVVEKMVAAQKMADIMLNIYSPTASNPELAQYGNNYAVQHMLNDDIKDFIGHDGDVNELMNDVKVGLGLVKENKNEKIDIPAEIFDDNAGGVSDKIEEIKPATKEMKI